MPLFLVEITELEDREKIPFFAGFNTNDLIDFLVNQGTYSIVLGEQSEGMMSYLPKE